MFWSKSPSPLKVKQNTACNFEDAKTCRILVVGNPGVGKTSFVHLLAKGKVLHNPRWTCGCTVEVVAHMKENNDCHMIELWDIGANPKFKKSRRVFYKKLPSSSSSSSYPQFQPEDSTQNKYTSSYSDVDGLILVHDLSNSKSYSNLSGWLREVMREISSTNEFVWDTNIIFNQGNNTLPVILIGTKSDLVAKNSQAPELAELGVDMIEINTQNADTFLPGTLAFSKISTFFDKCIKNQEHEQYERHYEETSLRNSQDSDVSTQASYGWIMSEQQNNSDHHKHTSSPSNYTRNQKHVAKGKNHTSHEKTSFFQQTKSQNLDNSFPHSRASEAAYTNILDADINF